MKQIFRLLRPVRAAVLFSLALPVLAQVAATGPAPRLKGAIAGGAQSVLTGSQPPRVKAAPDLGAVPNDQSLKGITLVFNRSAAQEADLQALLAAQSNPASPLYHQWLTPDGFAARFGVADSDLGAVQSWLQSQGFSIDSIGRSRNRISFSGNAGQVAQAFGAPLHHYKVGGVTHTAPSADLSVPAALAPMVTGILHLSDFRPHPELTHVRPAYTSSKTQAHYLTPVDLATMYDASSVYSAGFNGAGQSLAIVGQSAIDPTDISRFQTADGLPTNLPTQVLVPGSGVSSIVGDGDEAESDIDLEFSTGMAQGAHVFFVYTGDDQYYGALDALQYAVEEDVAPVLSVSYGDCEIDVGASYSNMYNAVVGEQANAQGQTILSAAGDEGSTGCAPDTSSSLTPLQLESLSTEFPASLPTVTGMGGTQMVTGASTAGTSTYWTGASGSDVAGSLLSYVPETVWNEDNADYGLASGGGGVSLVFGRPTWQVGVAGIPAGTMRLVPDLSLQASGGNPGYVICTSDSSVLQSYFITSSCSNGFRDSTTGVLEAGYGGTSFSAPIMAGLLTVLNQATHSTGQGNINPTLYALATNSTTYASAFHDITSGSNACVANTVYDEDNSNFACTFGSQGYAAGTGYDEASGIGSIDFAKLVAAWPVAATTTSAAQIASTTTLSAASVTTAVNTADVVTITVAGSGTTTPTGSVTILSNGTAAGTLPLTGGQASFTFPGASVAGAYVIQASYSGDANFLPSSGAVSITVGTTVTAGTFTLSAGNITVATNGVSTGTVQVVPGTGYTGTVNFSVVFPSSSLTLCYNLAPVGTFANGASTGPQSATLTIGEGTACPTTSDFPQSHKGSNKLHAANHPDLQVPPSRRTPALTAFAGLLLAGLAFRRRSRRLASLLGVALLAVVSLGLSGCGSSTVQVPKNITTSSPANLTVTVVGTDSVTSSITSSTTFTLTVN